MRVARTIEFLPASARDDDTMAAYADDMERAGCDRAAPGSPRVGKEDREDRGH